MRQPTPESPPWDETLRLAFAGPREVGRQFAAGSLTAADAWALLDQLYNAADEAIQRWPSRSEHACAPGCMFCCFLWTDAMPLEVLRIADHLQRTMSLEDLAEVQGRLRDRLRASLGERPCGLLSAEGRCSVYALRPMTCRGFHSFSKAACQTSFEQPSSGPTAALDEQLHMLVAAMQGGVERSLNEHGFESGWVELNEALLHALEQAVSVDTWLANQPIFPWLSQ